MSREERRDAIVVGAGPAGLGAAARLAAGGFSVRVIDEQPAAGGQRWRGAAERIGDGPGVASRGDARRARAAAAVLHRPGVGHARGASVIDARIVPAGADGAPASVEVTWLATAGEGPRGLRDTRARALVVATGAMERAVLFPGATLPGVMSVGAVQGAMKQSGLVPHGAGVVLAGHGPLLRLVLGQILRLGGSVDAVLELAPGRSARQRRSLAASLARAIVADPVLVGRGVASLASGRRVRRYRDVRGLRAHGGESGESIGRIAFDSAVGRHTLPCRLLAVHDGIVPNVQLTRLLGLEHAWNDAQHAYAPVTDERGRAGTAPVWVAGDGGGIVGGELAVLRGELAGLDAARALGGGATAEADLAGAIRRLTRTVSRRLPARRLVDRLHPALPIGRHATPDTVVCRCEGVTLGRIDRAIAAGAVGPNRIKTFTRCGMGSCQGRLCGNALTRIVAERLGVPPDAVGALRVRPPLKPTLIGDYLGDDVPTRAPGDTPPPEPPGPVDRARGAAA